jgi:leader peptidase (prepilin peptidase)/N-methyltransferase
MVTSGLAGLALGWLAWLAAARFVGRYPPADLGPAAAEGNRSVTAGLALAGMALWGGWVGAQAASLPIGVSALVVSALLLCIALVDLRVRRIPNELVLALLAWAALQGVWLGRPGWGAALLGLALAGGSFLLLYYLGRGALGLGDVKLMAALGALLGYPAIVAGMLAGILAGGLAAAILLLSRRAGRRDPFAYGAWLALGAWLVYARLLGLWP